MPVRVIPHGLLTVEEYLEMKATASVRHEYVGGMVYAMVGTTKRHNRIAGNVYARLLTAARGGPCRVYMEAVKLRMEDVIYYPDVMVACGAEDDDPLIENAPCLVVEVASPPTESIDRREKMLAYKSIPTLRAYLIVAQDDRRVERYWPRMGCGARASRGRGQRGAHPLPQPDRDHPIGDLRRARVADQQNADSFLRHARQTGTQSRFAGKRPVEAHGRNEALPAAYSRQARPRFALSRRAAYLRGLVTERWG